MLVRDLGDMWQIVLQPDHADLSGRLAQAWGGTAGFVAPEPLGSVAVAAARHDDGWAVWERAPDLNPATRGPRQFLDVDVLSHLAFYRACIAAVTQQDLYAGLLVSMHSAGIYRGRYGTQPDLKLTFADLVKDAVDTFVDEQESAYPTRRAEIGVSESEAMDNYRLLQVFDRLSLYFCLRDLEEGEGDTLGSVPRSYDGDIASLEISPAGRWHVRIDPFPFAASPARFTLARRLVPKSSWETDEEFRADFFATEPQLTEIVIERG